MHNLCRKLLVYMHFILLYEILPLCEVLNYSAPIKSNMKYALEVCNLNY
jgi:hypothetical protein